MTDQHDRRANETLKFLGTPAADWVLPRWDIDHNVLIVGAGQSGTALAFSLRRAGVGGISLIDAGREDQAGMWDRCARMRTLRTGKTLIGPDQGVSPLSFPSWYDAEKGEGAFATLTRIPTADWAAYLRWFRSIAAGPVHYQTRMTRIVPQGEHLRVHLESATGSSVATARKVILTGGIEGLGVPRLPEILAHLPAGLCAHTASPIDFTALAGRDVAVVGVGPSAFDAAAVALEAGATAVHMYGRRADIPSRVGVRNRRYFGAHENFSLLPDRIKWRLVYRARALGTMPPIDSIARATVHPNFHIHLAQPLRRVERVGDEVAIGTDGDTRRFDFVVAATGYRQDLTLRPELESIASDIALWRDRYEPPEDERDAAMGAHPYLGPDFQFTEKVAGEAPYLRNVHAYTTAAQLSFGRHISDVPSMESGIRRLTRAIVRDLFFDDLDRHAQRMSEAPEPDFSPEAYAAALWDDAKEPASAGI